MVCSLLSDHAGNYENIDQSVPSNTIETASPHSTIDKTSPYDPWCFFSLHVEHQNITSAMSTKLSLDAQSAHFFSPTAAFQIAVVIDPFVITKCIHVSVHYCKCNKLRGWLCEWQLDVYFQCIMDLGKLPIIFFFSFFFTAPAVVLGFYRLGRYWNVVGFGCIYFFQNSMFIRLLCTSLQYTAPFMWVSRSSCKFALHSRINYSWLRLLLVCLKNV